MACERHLDCHTPVRPTLSTTIALSMDIALYSQVSHLLSPHEFRSTCTLLRRLRPIVVSALAHRDNRQQSLPRDVADFIVASVGVDLHKLSLCWPVLRPYIVMESQDIDYQRLADDIFRVHGSQFRLGKLIRRTRLGELSN